MASGPITSWEIDGERVETVATVAAFIFLGSKITADGDCNQKLEDAYCQHPLDHGKTKRVPEKHLFLLY